MAEDTPDVALDLPTEENTAVATKAEGAEKTEDAASAESSAFLAKATQKAFMNIQIGGKDAGKLTFALFGETVPKTVENFAHLC